jgi:hypothetical protein
MEEGLSMGVCCNLFNLLMKTFGAYPFEWCERTIRDDYSIFFGFRGFLNVARTLI